MLLPQAYPHFHLQESVNYGRHRLLKPEVLEGWHTLNSGALRAMLQWGRTKAPRSLESSPQIPPGTTGASRPSSQASKEPDSGCSGPSSRSGSSNMHSTSAAPAGAAVGGAAVGSSVTNHSDTESTISSGTSIGSSDCWNDAGVDDWDW